MTEIPTFTKYEITKDCEVFSKKTNKLLSGSINNSGYRFYHLIGDDGKDHNVGEHRLMALAFIGKPYNERVLVVNHKDGIKLNNDIDNLEWCTQRENAIHAGHTGLSSKACSVQVRNVINCEILYFQTMIDCSKHFNVSKDAISYRCKCGPTRIFPGGLQYRSPASLNDWPDITDIDLVMMVNGKKRALFVKDLETGIIDHFEKISDAADFLKLSQSNITGHFKRNDQPVIKNKYQLKKSLDINPWQEPFSFKTTQKVEVFNIRTGKTTIYETAVKAAKENNLKPTTLNYRLSLDSNKVFSDGKSYKRI